MYHHSIEEIGRGVKYYIYKYIYPYGIGLMKHTLPIIFRTPFVGVELIAPRIFSLPTCHGSWKEPAGIQPRVMTFGGRF